MLTPFIDYRIVLAIPPRLLQLQGRPPYQFQSPVVGNQPPQDSSNKVGSAIPGVAGAAIPLPAPASSSSRKESSKSKSREESSSKKHRNGAGGSSEVCFLMITGGGGGGGGRGREQLS